MKEKSDPIEFLLYAHYITQLTSRHFVISPTKAINDNLRQITLFAAEPRHREAASREETRRCKPYSGGDNGQKKGLRMAGLF
jgi:hypothetical protein